MAEIFTKQYTSKPKPKGLIALHKDQFGASPRITKDLALKLKEPIGAPIMVKTDSSDTKFKEQTVVGQKQPISTLVCLRASFGMSQMKVLGQLSKNKRDHSYLKQKTKLKLLIILRNELS